MEKLLEKLFSDQGKLSLLLLEAIPYAEESEDKSFIEFIKNESEGYDSTKDLPDYRKIKGRIIGDIQDGYGQFVYQGKTLDFSVLSEHLGLNLEDSPIPDSIGFIEAGLEKLTGQLAARPIPSKLVKMLNETFQHNNPHLKLVSASHEFGTAALQFILTKVRQDLIIGLQKLNKSKKDEVMEIIEDSSENPKPVFVTYAWGNDEHNETVISFVDFLRKSGYEASMDRKFSQEETAINFNKMMVEGIQNSEKVIIILNSNYKKKADNFEGGVGVEIQIILEEIKTNPNKYIFASFGQEEHAKIVPTSIAGREILNLKKDQDETNFNVLFSKLDSKNIIEFSDVKKVVNEIKTVQIKPFKL